MLAVARSTRPNRCPRAVCPSSSFGRWKTCYLGRQRREARNGHPQRLGADPLQRRRSRRCRPHCASHIGQAGGGSDHDRHRHDAQRLLRFNTSKRLLNAVTAQPSLRLVGLCTHFAESENTQSPLTIRQIDRFRSATDEAASRSKGKLIRHAANSGAIFFQPQSHFDMVRPGISLFGIDPTFIPSLDRPLRPVLQMDRPADTSLRTSKKGRASVTARPGMPTAIRASAWCPSGMPTGTLRALRNIATRAD